MKRFEKFVQILAEKNDSKRDDKIDNLNEKEAKLLLKATLKTIKKHEINEL